MKSNQYILIGNAFGTPNNGTIHMTQVIKLKIFEIIDNLQ